ncbi:hypothetical protein [Rhizobium rhizogenes]|uniref:Uncharacterized protein n=1 Tax=Rhizobium rhizogenes (strain K84 / ATCC BAA-868) TaxID=311403 RepID=B9JF60_RHIR8|nr:hypothetical protein Arad_2332 [Rhizobium rhizogenes K84]
MDRARILNLLDTMEVRIERLQKAFAPIASPAVHDILQLLRQLKIKAGRCRSKVDVLEPASIADLRETIDNIRNFASSPDLNVQLIDPVYENRLARDGLLEEADFLARLANGMLIGLNLTANDVRELLPAQKPAAFRFAYDNDNQKIVVVDEPFRPDPKQAEIALAALEEIISQGQDVNDDLQQSNASPRLKAAFVRLQERLIAHRNIVQVGQCNQTAGRVLKGHVEELSSSQFEQLRAQVEGVSAVLAQFPEWRHFSENAVRTNLDNDAIAELTADALLLAQQLKKSVHAVAEVPQALEEAAEWVKEQDEPDKRDVLSLVRTLENFWSLLTKNALAKEIKSETKKMIAKGIILATLSVLSVGFASNIAKVPGGEWIEATFAYLKAHIQTFIPK